MKQILFAALAAVAVLTSSCSKDDNDSAKSNPIKISIGGAKYIYENPMATRASSGELARFMAVNDKGESKQIRFLNSNNDTIDMDISVIKNLGDEYVILGGDFRYTDNAGTVRFFTMLANKKTELVYAMNAKFHLSYDKTPTYIDQNNNLYQQTGMYDDMIYQYNVSDPNNVRLSEYIPKDMMISRGEFIVNKRGFCYMTTSYKQFKIKCPGGRIYSHLELLPEGVENFSIFRGYKNDTFFMVAHHERNYQTDKCKNICYELVENGLNELVVTQRSEVETQHPYGGYSRAFSNHIQKTHLMEGGVDILEYDEETKQFTELNLQLPDLNSYNYKSITKNNLFIYDKAKNELVILKLADNTITRINLVGKYELMSMDGDIDSDEVTFSGLRFSDGRNIVGTIDERGQFHAIETINATKETVLIRLN